MKFLRLGPVGTEVPCVLDAGNTARDISSIIHDFTPETIPAIGELLADVDLSTLPVVEQDGARIAAPMTQPRNVYCIGLRSSASALMMFSARLPITIPSSTSQSSFVIFGEYRIGALGAQNVTADLLNKIGSAGISMPASAA